MKIKDIKENWITFDNGLEMSSYHKSECCEDHYVDFSAMLGQGYEGQEFSEKLSEMIVLDEKGKVSNDDFSETFESGSKYKKDIDYTFVKIKDLRGNTYTLPIYNSNNGYYSDNVDIHLCKGIVCEEINIQ